MTDTLIVSETAVERTLGACERRPAMLSLLEVRKREAALAFGAELNRIQGAASEPLVERLGQLWCTGRITKEAYIELVGKLARSGATGWGSRMISRSRLPKLPLRN